VNEYDDHWPQMHPDDIRDTFEGLYAQYPFYGQLFGHAEAMMNQVQMRPNHVWFEDDEAMYVKFQRGARDITLIFSLDGERDMALGYDAITDEFTEYEIDNFQMIRGYLGEFG